MKKLLLIFVIFLFLFTLCLSEKLVGSTSNDDLLVTVSLGERGLLAPYNLYVLEITNLSDERIKIIWDYCLIIDRYKQMTRMIMGDSYLSEANKEQMPTLILPNSSLIEPVVPVSHIINQESIHKIDGAIGEITFYLNYLKIRKKRNFMEQFIIKINQVGSMKIRVRYL